MCNVKFLNKFRFTGDPVFPSFVKVGASFVFLEDIF